MRECMCVYKCVQYEFTCRHVCRPTWPWQDLGSLPPSWGQLSHTQMLVPWAGQEVSLWIGLCENQTLFSFLFLRCFICIADESLGSLKRKASSFLCGTTCTLSSLFYKQALAGTRGICHLNDPSPPESKIHFLVYGALVKVLILDFLQTEPQASVFSTHHSLPVHSTLP